MCAGEVVSTSVPIFQPVVTAMNQKQMQFDTRWVVLLACLLVSSAAVPAWSAGIRHSESFLRQTIVSLNKARNSIFEKQYMAESSDVPSVHSKEDVQLFITYLDGRIYHYCRELYLANGPGSLEDLNCPTGSEGEQEATQFDSVPDFSGQTSGEKVAQLDQDFNAALGEFDDMLLKEQETVAAHIPRQRESGASASGRENEPDSGKDSGGPSGAENTSDMEQSGKSGNTDTTAPESAGERRNGATQQGAGSGRKNTSQLPPTEGPKDLSEKDDDIVARQLREAAEQETDPEVKEKLWEEYRKYREGTK